MEENKKITSIALLIIAILILIAGSTFAYFAFSASNNIITGDMGSVNLSLTVTKVLPDTTTIDDILVSSFNNLATNINNKCLYTDGEYALCQIYKVTLTNNSDGVNTRVSGSISFNNPDSPNLSWIKINNYDSATTYTNSMLGSTFNPATSAFTKFENSYLLEQAKTVEYYIVVWVNETEEAQTDDGSFTGTIRFEDENGKGVTSTFGE